MALAENILNFYSYNGPFIEFAYSRLGRRINVLEINEAGGLHKFLVNFKNITFAKFPEVDIQHLPYKDESYDVIIHSDTLEHIENRYLALEECYRVAKSDGVLFYTIPIINGRMTRDRNGLRDSFHGNQEESQGHDYKVWTEYGSDFWVELFKVGFKEIRLVTVTDQSTISICARKIPYKRYRKNKLILVVKLILMIVRKIKAIQYEIYRRKIHT
jgi:SAM-dependent methyltransferase